MKKASTAKKGQYYKRKTKLWFIEKGWATEYVERMQVIHAKAGKLVYIKKDLWGADGCSMNGKEIIFWNSKFGRLHINDGIEEFKKYPYPPQVQRWLVVWEKGVKEPEIINVTV